MATPEYSKGYAAGRKKSEAEIKRLNSIIRKRQSDAEELRRERIYFQCLELALSQCDGWEIGGKKVNNVETFSRLAEIFMENAIKRL